MPAEIMNSLCGYTLQIEAQLLIYKLCAMYAGDTGLQFSRCDFNGYCFAVKDT